MELKGWREWLLTGYCVGQEQIITNTNILKPDSKHHLGSILYFIWTTLRIIQRAGKRTKGTKFHWLNITSDIQCVALHVRNSETPTDLLNSCHKVAFQSTRQTLQTYMMSSRDEKIYFVKTNNYIYYSSNVSIQSNLYHITENLIVFTAA